MFAQPREADELDERVRRLLERCDALAGVLLFAELDSAFGGVAAELVARVRDDVPKAPLLACAVQAVGRDVDDAAAAGELGARKNVVHGSRALTLAALQQHASLLLPLTIGTAGSRYRAAAPPALAVDTLLSATRLTGRTGVRSLDSLVATLNSGAHSTWFALQSTAVDNDNQIRPIWQSRTPYITAQE